MRYFWSYEQNWTNLIIFTSILVFLLSLDLGTTQKSKSSNNNLNSTTLLRNSAKNSLSGADVRLLYNQKKISKNNIDNSFNVKKNNDTSAKKKLKKKGRKSENKSSVKVKSTKNKNPKLSKKNSSSSETIQHYFNPIDNKQHEVFHNQSKDLLNQQKLNLQQHSKNLKLQQQQIKQLQLLKNEHRRLLTESPVKECSVTSGQSVYHVTVVRGDCCKKISSYDDAIQSDQPIGNGHDYRMYHDDGRYKNNVVGEEDGGMDFSSKSSQNIDYSAGRNNGRYKNNPNKKFFPKFQKSNNRHQSVAQKQFNYFNHTTHDNEYDTNDFESVFLLDKMSKVEKQIFEARREMKGKINRLMHSVKKNNVEKYLRVQQQQLLKLQQQLRESYKNLSKQQEQQQNQQIVELIEMRENYLDQTKEQQKLNELIKLVHKEQQQHQEKVKMEEERRKLEEEQLKQIKEKKEEEKIEKEKAKIEKEKGSRHGNPYLKLNTNDYNGDTSFSIIDNQIQATKAAKNKNNFQRKLRLLKSKKHAGFNQELNSDLLKDEPGRHEHWLNMLHQSFSTLREELVSVKERLGVTELKLNEEIVKKEKFRGELKISQQDLQLTKQDLEYSVQLQAETAKNLSDAVMWQEHLAKKLNEEIQSHEEAKNELSQVLESHEKLEGEHRQQVMLIDVIRNRLSDCINNQLTLHCEFEDGRLCGFVQDNYSDHLDWVRTNGDKKPDENDSLGRYGEVIGMRETRPTLDHTCGCKNGHFMHVKATEKLIGQVARMKTTRMFGFEEQCIEFYYWVSGKFVGTLNVYTEVPDEGLLSSVWRVFGDQGNVWIRARLDISIEVVRAGYKVVFEGILDRGLLGDIAIDDFKVLPGNCTTIDL